MWQSKSQRQNLVDKGISISWDAHQLFNELSARTNFDANQGKVIGITAVSLDFSEPIFKMSFKKKNVYRNAPSDRHPYTLNTIGNEYTAPPRPPSPLYFNQNVFFCISVIVVHWMRNAGVLRLLELLSIQTVIQAWGSRGSAYV